MRLGFRPWRKRKVVIMSVESIRDIFHVFLLLGLSPPHQLCSYLLLLVLPYFLSIHDFNSDRWMASISDVPKDWEVETVKSLSPLSDWIQLDSVLEREK